MAVRAKSDYAKGGPEVKEDLFLQFWNDYIAIDHGPLASNHDDFLARSLDLQIDTKMKMRKWQEIEEDRLNPSKVHVNLNSIKRHLSCLCTICRVRHEHMAIALTFSDRLREGWFCFEVRPTLLDRKIHYMDGWTNVDEKSSRQPVILVDLAELDLVPDYLFALKRGKSSIRYL